MQPALCHSSGRPPDFSTMMARQWTAWNSGGHAVTGTTTERAALFGPFRRVRREQFPPEGEKPIWPAIGPGQSGPG